MATVRFIKKSENGSIYVRVRKGRMIDQIASTNLFLPIEDWDKDSGYPKRGIKEGERKRSAELIRNQLLMIERNLNLKLNTISTSSVSKNWLNDIINPKPVEEIIGTISLSDYIDIYISDINKGLKESSKRHAFTVKSLLVKFSDETKFDLNMFNLDRIFINKFKSWMALKKYSLGYSSRTLKAIKGYCRHANSTRDIPISNDIKNIKVKFEKSLFVVFNEDELAKIYSTKMSSQRLENIKLWLMVSCYTGQRVSDFLRLTKKNLMFDNRIERYVLDFVQIKTGIHVKLPVMKALEDILKVRDFNFPKRISERKYNEYLKEVCKEAGIDNLVEGSRQNPLTNRKEKGIYPKYELITSHIGRRTFATNNYSKISTTVLMYATGHTSIDSFKRYINKTEDDKMLEIYKQFKENNI